MAAQRWPVRITINEHTVQGTLTLPSEAKGIVLFAHGNGSGRPDPRNDYVAGVLNRSGLGTLLFDLLTPEEDAAEQTLPRFNIPLLAGRLLRATEWVASQPGTLGLPIGYFGASTGAAAALVAAADWPDQVAAVVALGGRPDLAGDELKRVKAPTLLIVGSEDHDVLALNRSARRHLRVESDVAVVPSATHLVDGPDALEEVAALASAWFTRHLAAGRLAPALGEAR